MRLHTTSLIRIPPYRSGRTPLLSRSLASIARPGSWLSIFSPPRPSPLEETLERETGRKARKEGLISGLVARFVRVRRDMDEDVGVRLQRPPGKRIYLKNLNEHLRKALANPTDDDTRRGLWKWYTRCRLSVPGVLAALPDKAWDLLWETQSRKSLSNPNSVEHLKQLVEDMHSVGHTSTFTQRLAHLEATFLMGQREKALKEWEGGFSTAAGRTLDGDKPEYMELGVRMYSIAGKAARAQDILIELFALYPEWDPRVIMPVFEAHIQVNTDDSIRQALALYLHMKGLLGDKMDLKHYEKCYLGFLHRERRKQALAVFTDMMLSSRLRDGGKIRKYLNNLQAVCKNASELSEGYLVGLSVLPREHQNVFFFGKWIKRLIQMGNLDSAVQVVELMYERGIRPAPRYLNGIMGAWLRTGDPENIRKAESLGLQMVAQRFALVQERNNREKKLPRNLYNATRFQAAPLFRTRTAPAATSETFGVLIEMALKQSDFQKVQDLRTWQSKAELPLNTATMNAFLIAYIERSQYSEVFRTYRRFTNGPKDRAVRPDEATYACLWNTSVAKANHRGVRSRQNQVRFPSPRVIMAEMLRWLAGVHNKPLAVTHLVSRNRVYHRIIQSFCLAKDLPGALVALHIMKERLGVYPSPKIATTLAKHMARIGFRDRSPLQRRRLAHSVAYLQNVGSVLRVFEVLADRRQREMLEADPRLDEKELGETAKAELQLNVLSELVRVVLVRQLGPDQAELRIERAKHRMGVEDIGTGDRDSFHVG